MADPPGSQNPRARPERHEEQTHDLMGQAFRPLPSSSTTTTASPSRSAGTFHTSHEHSTRLCPLVYPLMAHTARRARATGERERLKEAQCSRAAPVARPFIHPLHGDADGTLRPPLAREPQPGSGTEHRTVTPLDALGFPKMAFFLGKIECSQHRNSYSTLTALHSNMYRAHSINM